MGIYLNSISPYSLYKSEYTRPYDEIFYYVKHNIAEVRNDLALMISGEGGVG